MKHKILLSTFLMTLSLFYFISCQKSLNENFNPSINNTDSTDTSKSSQCDTTIIGIDTCIKCNDTCVTCPGLCDTTKPLVFYIDHNGSASNSGRTPNNALPTINDVQEKLIKYYKILHQDVEVRIKFTSINMPYTGQKVRWKYYSPIHNISFMPSDYKYGEGINDIQGRPIFDGGGITEDYFFRLVVKDGQRTNIRFYYLQIKGYTTGGIQFRGDYDIENWNGYNTVYGCYFENIGDKRNPELNSGYSALDLVNSDFNIIQENHFVHCENGIGKESHMHGVYLAHSSDYNLVEHNNFSWISGDAVRVRDYSNYNIIIDNDIKRCGIYAYFSGFRYHNGVTNNIECRSYQNEFRKNRLSCGYYGQDIKLIAFFYKYDPDDKGPDPGKQEEDWDEKNFPLGDCIELGEKVLYENDNDEAEDCD